MAKPKKAPKVNKTQNVSKKAPNPTPSPPPPPVIPTASTTITTQPSQSMSGPAKASPKPQPTLSKADQVRDIWQKFFTSFYTPALNRWIESDDDNEEEFRSSIRDAWAGRLQEQGLEEQDWSDITPAEQVAVYDAFFGVVCDEKDIASIEANMKTALQPQPQSISSSSPPSSSPPQPVASTSSHSLVSPAPAMSASLSSSSTYATVNPASFGYDAEDSEESEFAFFEAISDGAISTPISPSSLSSNNWWTSDSLQTSPSTSPSSKPVMVDFPVSAHHMLEDEPPGAFPALWKHSAAASVAHVQTDSPSTPLGKITEWFSALNPTSIEPPIRAPEWPDEAIWENGLKSLKDDKPSKDKSKAVAPDQVDWSMAWKTVQAEEAASTAKEEPQPRQKAKAKGKKDLGRTPSTVDDTKNKQTTDPVASKPVSFRDRKLSVSNPFGEPSKSQSTSGRDSKASSSQPEPKTVGGWKKTDTAIPIPAPKRQASQDPDWSAIRPESRATQQIDWASVRKTMEQEQEQEQGNAYDWSDNDEPQTPIVNPRITMHHTHSLSHLEIPQALSASNSSSTSEYIGPILSDPSDYGLALTPSMINSPDVDKMEREFADFKIMTRMQLIRNFHDEAVKRETELVLALHNPRISKGEVSRRVAEHTLHMTTLQRDKENERKLKVDEERKRRVKEMERQALERQKLEMEARERQMKEDQALAMKLRREEEEARAAELRVKEAELRRKEQLLKEQEQELRRREEEVKRQQSEERESEARRRRADELRLQREREEQHRREQEHRRRQDEDRRLQEEDRRRQEERRRQDDEKRRLATEQDPVRRAQIEKDEELARQLEREGRQLEMHKRQQEILEKKRQQQEREANNATVRPADRNRWLPASTSGDDKSKRQVIPSFTPPETKSSAPQKSNATSTWAVTTSVPAPPKMTTRSVDPKAPLAAVAKAAEATTSKITLDQMRGDPTPQPPRLSHKSASSTPDNRTIWHPKPEPKLEPMTRSTRIEKSKSTSVVARTRTLSDPVPSSPRAATKALPGSSTPPRQEKEKEQVEKKPASEQKPSIQDKEEGKGKKKVTVEDVPETDDAVGGGLPSDSTALMLSNIEPESPSLVERELKENEAIEKARHVRWTPPSEAATSTTTRPRANSTAKQAQSGRAGGARVY